MKVINFYKNIAIKFTIPQQRIPKIVGKAIDNNVHFKLPVSLWIVRQVVEHGQWNNENKIKHNAVFAVQPFAIKSAAKSERELVSTNVPTDK